MGLVLMLGIALMGGIFSLALIGGVLSNSLKSIEEQSRQLHSIEGVAEKKVQSEPQEEVVDSSLRDRLRSAFAQDELDSDSDRRD